MISNTDKIVELIFSHPLSEKVVTFYQSQSKRDQNAIAVLSIFLLAAGLVFGLVVPAHKSAMSSLSDYEDRIAEYQWLKSNEQVARSTVNVQKDTGESLEASVTRAAHSAGIELQRYEPTSDNKLRVWLDQVPFDGFMRLVKIIELESGLSIQQVELEQAGAGIVNVTMMLRE